MAIYSLVDKSFHKMTPTTFSSEGIRERGDLQPAIKDKIDVIAPDCLIIAEEFSEWSESQRRIDLLAIDKMGNLVVIELKRSDTGDHMELQALRYSAMISTLTFKRTVKIYEKYLLSIGDQDEAEDKLLAFLGWDEPQEDDFALDVRIILVSANFSKELTTSVMWLNERNLDIKCVRLVPYRYKSEIFIDVQQLVPLPEAESYQVKIRQQADERREARKLSKDYTKYYFEDSLEELNKRKLGLAIITKFYNDNQPNNIEELQNLFPEKFRRKLFRSIEQAKEIEDTNGQARHFVKEEDLLNFQDGTQYAISNQWSKESIDNLISHAQNNGYSIEKKE